MKKKSSRLRVLTDKPVRLGSSSSKPLSKKSPTLRSATSAEERMYTPRLGLDCQVCGVPMTVHDGFTCKDAKLAQAALLDAMLRRSVGNIDPLAALTPPPSNHREGHIEVRFTSGSTEVIARHQLPAVPRVGDYVDLPLRGGWVQAVSWRFDTSGPYVVVVLSYSRG